MKIKSKAPLRIGLAGGGTDVSPYSEDHGGAILNATISLYAHCVIENLSEKKIIINAVDINKSAEFKSSTKLFPINGELDLIKQILNHFINKGYIKEFTPFKITTFCDAPPGTGLGSSSTLVVSVIKAISEWKNIPLGEYDIAQMAYKIEREELKFSGGKQDQYAATFGGFNFMEFSENNRVIVNPLRLKQWVIDELESSILLFNIGTSRLSSKIIDDQTSLMKKEIDVIKNLHIIKNAAFSMKNSILTGNLKEISKIVEKSWNSKKSLSKFITNKNIEKIYNTALQNGAYSGKISGAGGGGIIMFIVDIRKRLNLIKIMNELGCKHINFVFTNGGCKSWKI